MPDPIHRDEVRRLIREEQAQIVDVLPAWEYEEMHLPDAISIPLKRLDRGTVSVLDRGKPVVVY